MSDVDRSIMERGDLVPCDDVTCQGQGQLEVTRACDVTRSTCVCSRGFVLQEDRCVGWLFLLFYLLGGDSRRAAFRLQETTAFAEKPARRDVMLPAVACTVCEIFAFEL